jgi:two-component system sensor histidine kinase AtoS
VAQGPTSRHAVAAEGPLVQEVVSGGESFYDFAVPIQVGGQRWGTVRVGLSKRRVEAQIAETRRELALLAALILVAGGATAFLVARRIARPVRRLAEGAAALSRGEWDQRIEAGPSDEIGRLAEAFNRMAAELARERRALEAAHEELGRRFAELADLKGYTDDILGSLTSGIVTADLEGRVVTLNGAAQRLTGVDPARAPGRRAREVFAHLPELPQVLEETLASRTAAIIASVLPGRDADPPVPVEVTTAPLRGADGRDLGVVAVVRDLSAERQLEEQLRRSDRLAAIGTLAAGLAHEIKNPLTSLLTFTRHLTRRFDDERFRQRFQSVVPRELERIDRIVEDLLRLSRPARLSLSQVHVPGLLEQVLELYASDAEAKQIAVVREFAPGLPTVQADRSQLYQALVNLVANAVEAMGEGGVLTVRAGWAAGVEPAGRPRHRGQERRLQIEVADTGAGIAPGEQSNVFNPFFTTKPAGTGLGLAIAHKIVEDHGGTITFRSTPGRGTTFVVVLPLAVGHSALARGTEARGVR